MATNSNPTPPLGKLEKFAYRVSEFCVLSGICRATFYELLKAGKIRAVKCGSRTLIPADEVRRFHQALPSLVRSEAENV